jgi:hypothetical protein
VLCPSGILRKSLTLLLGLPKNLNRWNIMDVSCEPK